MLKRVFSIFLSVGLLVIAGYFLWKLAGVAYKRYALQLEISRLEGEIQKFEGDAKEIKKLIAYLGDKELLKIKAKEEFNLKEPGEQVVFVKGDTSGEVSKSKEGDQKKTESHWREWWDIFFGEK